MSTILKALKRLEDEDDLILKAKVEKFVRLVSFADGRIAAAFAPGANPKEIISGLQDRLKRWTGRSWLIDTQTAGGAPSVAEAREAQREATFTAISQHPLVKAALEIFPGAKITDVTDPETFGAPGDADPDMTEMVDDT